jgi:hypothetical protein
MLPLLFSSCCSKSPPFWSVIKTDGRRRTACNPCCPSRRLLVRLDATATNPNSRRSRCSCARGRRLRTGTPEAEPAILCIAGRIREALISVPLRRSAEIVSLCCSHHGAKRRKSRHRHHKLMHCCLPISFLVVQRPRVAGAALRAALASAVYSQSEGRLVTREVCWPDLRDSGGEYGQLVELPY